MENYLVELEDNQSKQVNQQPLLIKNLSSSTVTTDSTTTKCLEPNESVPLSSNILVNVPKHSFIDDQSYEELFISKENSSEILSLDQFNRKFEFNNFDDNDDEFQEDNITFNDENECFLRPTNHVSFHNQIPNIDIVDKNTAKKINSMILDPSSRSQSASSSLDNNFSAINGVRYYSTHRRGNKMYKKYIYNYPLMPAITGLKSALLTTSATAAAAGVCTLNRQSNNLI